MKIEINIYNSNISIVVNPEMNNTVNMEMPQDLADSLEEAYNI